MNKFIAVSKYKETIESEVMLADLPQAMEKVKILACRKVYRKAAEAPGGYADMIYRLPCVVYHVNDNEEDEVTLEGVQVMVRGLPVQACDIDCVNFRDITIV